MNNYKYIHVCPNEKFIAPFVDTLNKEFKIEEHFFIYLEGKSEKELPIESRPNHLIIKTMSGFLQNIKQITCLIERSNKLFIHGLYKWYFLIFLNLHKSLLSKAYWIIWGSDLYLYREKNRNLVNKIFECFRRGVIKNIPNFITYIKGDYDLLKQWYGIKGTYHECFMYPSNLYKDLNVNANRNETINIQIGNSADPSNNHSAVFDGLKKYKDNNINIFVPLSYGNEIHKKNVIKEGRAIFGKKFHAMTDFMSLDKYLEFLAAVDIAIFAHDRQQAMGNIITLLGLGKKVYMKQDITPWELFEKIKVKVFDVVSLNVEKLDDTTVKKNKEVIRAYFSQEHYIKQLKLVIEH